MKESKQEKLERIVAEAIERAEFDKKNYEGVVYTRKVTRQTKGLMSNIL